MLILQNFLYAAGPIEKSLDDFWMMVWMQNANRIVMVTKLIEGYRVSDCRSKRVATS